MKEASCLFYPMLGEEEKSIWPNIILALSQGRADKILPILLKGQRLRYKVKVH